MGAKEALMDQRRFVARRGPAWQQLELLVQQAGKRGLRALEAEKLFELGRLYRCATSDLAYAQAHAYDPRLLTYLNRLVARSHAYVYGGAVESGRTRVVRFFTHTFPREFRKSLWCIAACAALTVLWAAISYTQVARNPAQAYALLPEAFVPQRITKSLHDSNFAIAPEDSAEISSEIITNNIRVAVFAFAGGIVTLGIFTVYIISLNGIMLGALGALYGRAGFGPDFWATIAPHGVIELTAIQIAGGAGLLIAAAVFFPGRLRRRDAIVQHSRRAGILIGGVAGMLCVAGIIEAFFSPLRFPAEIRASVGIATGALLIAYFTLSGRDSTSTDPSGAR